MTTTIMADYGSSDDDKQQWWIALMMIGTDCGSIDWELEFFFYFVLHGDGLT